MDKLEKQKIVGISKSEFRSCYYFEKKQSFFSFVRAFLSDLGFVDIHVKHYGLKYSDKEGDYTNEFEDIKKYSKLENFQNEIYSVDLFPLSNRMVMIIHYKKDKQQAVVKILEKYSKFV
jgi:hypothetical protein